MWQMPAWTLEVRLEQRQREQWRAYYSGSINNSGNTRQETGAPAIEL